MDPNEIENHDSGAKTKEDIEFYDTRIDPEHELIKVDRDPMERCQKLSDVEICKDYKDWQKDSWVTEAPDFEEDFEPEDLKWPHIPGHSV